jgi:O-methyltransferase
MDIMWSKGAIKYLAEKLGYEIRKRGNKNTTVRNIPDVSFYKPFFSPWHGYGDFRSFLEVSKPFSVIPPDRLYVLYIIASQAINLDGHLYECGVYKGGSAMLLAKLLAERKKHPKTKLHLFDTFEGMPETDPQKDKHIGGDFADTSIDMVRLRVTSLISDDSIVEFHKGPIPDTFINCESHRISFAHIDVDIYKSVMDCCNFIYPRLQNGGFMVFDDYGSPMCPGARKAVDEFFKDKWEVPLVLSMGHAIVFRGMDDNY